MKEKIAHDLINKWVKKLGNGFHPETRAIEYCDQHGNQSLTADEQHIYEMDMELAFGFVGDKVFDMTLDCMNRISK